MKTEKSSNLKERRLWQVERVALAAIPRAASQHEQAEAAGGKVAMPPADMFWGDRWSKLVDPFGHEWLIATHKEDVAPEEMDKRGKAFMAQMCAKK